MECNICLQPLNPEHNPPTICGHYFHKNCLCRWLNETRDRSGPPTCPTCRSDITYERAIIDFYTLGRRITKKIQNMDGDYFFYPSSKIKYFLEIDRKTNLITGGFVMNQDNTEKKEITPEIIQTQYEKLEQQRDDEDYDLWEELVSI